MATPEPLEVECLAEAINDHLSRQYDLKSNDLGLTDEITTAIREHFEGLVVTVGGSE